MKRFCVLVGLVAAACGGQKTETAAAPAPSTGGNGTVVGTFTAEVNPATGKLTFLNDSAVGGVALGHGQLQIPRSDTAFSNTPDGEWEQFFGPPFPASNPWFDYADESTGCGPGQSTWGAVVRTTNTLSATTSLSGVYAEMTWAIGQTGTDACNSATDYPAGVNNNDGLGLWAIPSMLTSGFSYSDSIWSFKYNTGSYFRFGGVVKAAKIEDLPATSTAGPITANGTDGIVYAAGAGKLERMKISDETTSTTAAIAGDPNQIVTAVAADASRVWFASGLPGRTSVAGWVASSFAPLTVRVSETMGDSQNCFSIAPDAGGTFAWVVCRATQVVRVVSNAAPPVVDTGFTLNTSSFAGAAQPEMMVADATNLYITFKTANVVAAYLKAGEDGLRAPAWFAPTTADFANCGSPENIVLSADGNTLYFTGHNGGTVGAICSVPVGGGTVSEIVTFTKEVNAPYLCINQDNDLVYVQAASQNMVRVKAKGTSTNDQWTILLPSAPGRCTKATSDGTNYKTFLSTAGAGINRVTF
jgi:hypothetical protein